VARRQNGGLVALQAVQHDLDHAISGITAPDATAIVIVIEFALIAAKPGQIAITSFGSETETVLEILPPESTDAHDVRATVSDRSNTLFELPPKPEPGLVPLSDLPLPSNDLPEAIPAFLTITVMTFGYNISYGIAAGFITYCIINLIKGRGKRVHPILYGAAILFLLNFVLIAFNKL